MESARDFLWQELNQLIEKSDRTTISSGIERCLKKYRVQIKDGKNNSHRGKAREVLLEELLLVPPKGDGQAILDRYRIQRVRKTAPKKVEENAPFDNSKKNQMTYKKPAPEPLAGGPRSKSGERGVCPKCHSTSIVLTPSVSEDAYFACVYCGYQSYKMPGNAGGDLEAAAQILGGKREE